MPKVKANAYLSTPKGMVQTGDVVELTKEQIERLGDKVSPIEETVKEGFVQGEVYTEAEFRAFPAEEQKKAVEYYDGDLNEYTNEDKRWSFVSDNQ